VRRLYFDITLKGGAVEKDSTGVLVSDVAIALHECIDAIIELPQGDIECVIVKDENGVVMMVLNVDALGDTPTIVAENRSN
jgi:hypothetical protein